MAVTPKKDYNNKGGYKVPDDVVDVYHYNDKTKEYKSMKFQPTPKKDGVFVNAISGESGNPDSKQTISMKLNKMELAFLILELQNLYNNEL